MSIHLSVPIYQILFSLVIEGHIVFLTKSTSLLTGVLLQLSGQARYPAWYSTMPIDDKVTYL
jgi:hypothetical protein